MPDGCLFFFSAETTEDTMKKGVCFGVNFGEAKHSDEQDDEKENENENENEINYRQVQGQKGAGNEHV